MEMMGSGGEWASKHFSAASNTARIAKTWGGMMRLYGGFLGGAVGIVGAVFDGYSAIDAFSRRRDALGIAYAARMMVVGAATVMGATVAFAGSAPFLKRMMLRVSSAFLKELFRVAAQLAVRLAAREALLFSLRIWGARLGWAGLAVSAAIVLLGPDDFEEWCERSVFRKDKGQRGFSNEGAELATLESAFKGIAS